MPRWSDNRKRDKADHDSVLAAPIPHAMPHKALGSCQCRRWVKLRLLLRFWLAAGAIFTFSTLRAPVLHGVVISSSIDSMMDHCVQHILSQQSHQFALSPNNRSAARATNQKWARQWCQEPAIFPPIQKFPLTSSSSSSSAESSSPSLTLRSTASITLHNSTTPATNEAMIDTEAGDNLPYNLPSSSKSSFSRQRWRRRKQKQLQQQLNEIDAQDTNGQGGYIANPSHLRTVLAKMPSPSFELGCRVPPGEAEEGPWGIQGIWKIRQSLLESTKASSLSVAHQNVSTTSRRLLCLVYTHSNRHESVLRSILDTWAPACDGFLAISNLTDPSLGAVHIVHPGEESYKNMWLKIRSAWLYVSKHYMHQYDWFHIGGDDHYLIPQHLKLLASTLPLTEPVYMGASMTTQRPTHRFCGGGAGYTLNSAALRLLALSLTDFQTNLTASAEDRLVGLLFSRTFHNLQCRNTNDPLNEGRYHHLDINFHASLIPGRLVPWNWRALEKLHNISTFQHGLHQISNTSISFHLSAAMIDSASPDRGMRRYHALLFGKCGPLFDQQMQVIYNYTRDELKAKIVPGFRRNKYAWGKLKDRCAEAVTSRNQDMEGYVARKLCPHFFTGNASKSRLRQ